MIDNHSTEIKPDVLQQAMEWQVTLWSGEVSTEEQTAFDAWLQANPDHRLAWQKVQQVNQQLAQLPNQLATRVLHQTAGVDKNRRQLLIGAGAVVGLGILSLGASQTPQWRTATADYRTARGERRELTLPDGTQLMLNTASAVDVHFTAATRRLVLHTGEIQITTGADKNAAQVRPFWVETSAGVVRPIGTQFTLRQLDRTVFAQVTQGAVELMSAQGQGVRLESGQATKFDSAGVSLIQKASPVNSGWTRGLIIAEQQRLKDFIAELARYHSGVLRCDPGVADLRVSGVYPLQDSHSILRALEQVLPVRAHTRLGYWTTLTAR